MLEKYYAIKKRLGLKIFSDKRIARLSLLYPEKKPEEVIRERDEKTLKTAAIAVLVLVGIMSAYIITSAARTSEIFTVMRNPYGGGETEVELTAAMDGEMYEIKTRISSRELSDEEIDEKFGSAKSEMLEKLRGENEGLEHVSRPLNLDTACSDEDVTVFWQCTNYDLVDYQGNIIYGDGFVDGTKTSVKLLLSIGDEKRTYEEEITLYKPEDKAFTAKELIESEVAQAGEEQKEAAEVSLPEIVDGKEVKFYERSNSSSLIAILGLEIIGLFAIFYKTKKGEDDEMERRKEELSAGYPELVSKLSIYIGAGLSVRKAWEKMVEEYRKSRKAGGGRKALYEEMSLVIRMMESGKTEEECFSIFGDRVQSVEYLRLISVLESNRKNGRDKLKSFLSMEAKEAGAIRLEHAKRQGEKISSKLLFPMLMLFAIVLVVLIIPAFMGW